MKKITLIAVLALFGLTAVTSAQENVQRNRATELAALEAQLDEYMAELRQAGVAAAMPVYLDMKGRFRVARDVVGARPNSKDAAAVFTHCSTHAVAALMELERERNLALVRAKAATRDSLLIVLHNMHEAISRIEGGRAYKLSQELEAVQGKAAQLQDNLQATQANLAAERERLRQVMEDAQRRFSELQSELISVSKDARGTIITMSDILSDVGRATLTPTLRQNLARIAGILMVYREPNILVEGHTDNVGSREFNQRLSEERAANVVAFLVEQGVAQERLSSIGSAFDKPIADNSTPEGRAQNRRVDLIVEERALFEDMIENLAVEAKEEQPVEEIIGSEAPVQMESAE